MNTKSTNNDLRPLLAIPKGRLYPQIKELFESKGIKMPNVDTLQYYFPDWSEDCGLILLKPQSIPTLLQNKKIEFGFCGLDNILNSQCDDFVYKLMHTHCNEVKVCLCSTLTYEELMATKQPITVATELELLASKWLTENKRTHYIYNTHGATEAFTHLGMDAIIDVVETGATLKANGLQVIEEILTTDTCLFAHKDLCDCVLPDNIQKILS